MTVHAHDVTSSNQNKDLHYFATNMIVSRVEFNQLPNSDPKNDVKNIPLSRFLLNNSEMEKLRSDYMVLIGRVSFLAASHFLIKFFQNT